jgi:[NiFe] hydrogenase diaphorase moiety small subunit
MQESRFPHQFPKRQRDNSHPDVFLDRDRCIRCERCVRASRLLDGKNVFGVTGRGIRTTLEVNTPSGLLGESALATGDRAMALCPTGALLPKEGAWEVPVGARRFDRATVAEEDLREYAMTGASRTEEVHHG